MKELLDKMRKELFNYNFNNFSKYLTEILSSAQVKLIYLEEEEKEIVINTNILIQNALQDGDYFLISELLKYILYPILEVKEH